MLPLQVVEHLQLLFAENSGYTQRVWCIHFCHVRAVGCCPVYMGGCIVCVLYFRQKRLCTRQMVSHSPGALYPLRVGSVLLQVRSSCLRPADGSSKDEVDQTADNAACSHVANHSVHQPTCSAEPHTHAQSTFAMVMLPLRSLPDALLMFQKRLFANACRPIKILRLMLSLTYQVFYVCILNYFLAALNCQYLSTDATFKYHMLDFPGKSKWGYHTA